MAVVFRFHNLPRRSEDGRGSGFYLTMARQNVYLDTVKGQFCPRSISFFWYPFLSLAIAKFAMLDRRYREYPNLVLINSSPESWLERHRDFGLENCGKIIVLFGACIILK
ncbi:hypothetical protein SLA2020_446320 [Shorea laevis]